MLLFHIFWVKIQSKELLLVVICLVNGYRIGRQLSLISLNVATHLTEPFRFNYTLLIWNFFTAVNQISH
jgi:hypothetical protein